MITQYFEQLQEQAISIPHNWVSKDGIKKKLNDMGFSYREYLAIKHGYFNEKYVSKKRPTTRRA